jgi:hypothetical protein
MSQCEAGTYRIASSTSKCQHQLAFGRIIVIYAREESENVYNLHCNHGVMQNTMSACRSVWEGHSVILHISAL